MEKAFDIKPYKSEKMESAMDLWARLQDGKPPWLSEDIRTIKFSNTLTRELASLIVQNIDIKVDKEYGEDSKAKQIQEALDKSFLRNAQEHIEKMLRYGGIMAKWNGENIEYLTPDRFLVTDYKSDGEITGAVFFSYYTKGEKYYTKAEWHSREDGKYVIRNKAFVSDKYDDIGRETTLEKTKWSDIEPEVTLADMERPLFTYLKTPYSNTIDVDSPLGVSIISECIEELRWLDIAFSTMGVETEQSKPAMFVSESAVRYARNNNIELPAYMQGLDMGVSADGVVQHWQPTLQVQNRIDGINFYLSIISYKCGFDPSFFVFNGQAIQMATATQVEATERRTINTVKTYRNILDRPNSNGDGRVGFIHELAYIIDSADTVTGKAHPTEYGNYRLFCDFADLTENPEEEKAFDYQLTMQGFMSKVRFMVRNMGMTEEEARQYVTEAQEEMMQQQQAMASMNGLFSAE